MHGWYCLFHLIHLIRRKCLDFEKTRLKGKSFHHRFVSYHLSSVNHFCLKWCVIYLFWVILYINCISHVFIAGPILPYRVNNKMYIYLTSFGSICIFLSLDGQVYKAGNRFDSPFLILSAFCLFQKEYCMPQVALF